MNQKTTHPLRTTAVTLIVLLLVVGTTACSLGGPDRAQVETAQAASEAQQPMVSSAEAFVVPVQEADLSFETAGRIVSLEVGEGDPVSQGQVLARLDDTSQQTKVSEAQASLANAEASLAKAKASLAQAEANLANLEAGSTAEQIAQTKANLAKAQATLAELMEKPTAEALAEAEAKVETARANLAQVLAGSRDEEIQAAAARMLQAEAEVREAQADYDEHVYGELDRLGPYGLALEQATLDYEAAKADYDQLVNGATDEEIAVYTAQLYEAQTALDSVLAGATPAQIAQAQAEVERVEAELAELLAGATVEEIAASEANVEAAAADVEIAAAGIESARASLTSAQIDLAKTELVAPFDGLVGSLTINAGEYVQTGATIVSVGDTSRWQIETDDFNEIDRVGVREGAEVTFTVDALPNERFAGQVVRITPKSEIKAGDVTYTVLIEITAGDTSALSWGMTVFVDIEVEPGL